MQFFRVFAVVFSTIMLFILPKSAVCLELAPYKDKLFSYPQILDSRDGGDYLLIKYNKQVDLYARDEIPIAKVKQKYVRQGVRRHQTFEKFEYQGRHIEIGFVAKKGAPKFAVIFIHGRNGDRKLGMMDYNFGGNFNRLKNLAVRNNGLYLTQTIKEFSKSGVADTKALISYLYDQKKVRNIILVCASMGGQICNKIAHSQNDVARLSGLVLLGAIPDQGLARSHAVSVGLPIVLAHGNDDVVYSWENQRDVYRKIKARTSKYPVQFLLFDTGRHGTPIRMIDWRQSLNWIFKRS